MLFGTERVYKNGGRPIARRSVRLPPRRNNEHRVVDLKRPESSNARSFVRILGSSHVTRHYYYHRQKYYRHNTPHATNDSHSSDLIFGFLLIDQRQKSHDCFLERNELPLIEDHGEHSGERAVALGFDWRCRQEQNEFRERCSENQQILVGGFRRRDERQYGLSHRSNNEERQAQGTEIPKEVLLPR